MSHAGFYRTATGPGIPHDGFSHGLQEFCKTAMSLGFLTEEQASRVVQAQSQGRQFLPLCGFSVPLLILLANSMFSDCSWL